jgi:hypothetical protein
MEIIEGKALGSTHMPASGSLHSVFGFTFFAWLVGVAQRKAERETERERERER